MPSISADAISESSELTFHSGYAVFHERISALSLHGTLSDTSTVCKYLREGENIGSHSVHRSCLNVLPPNLRIVPAVTVSLTLIVLKSPVIPVASPRGWYHSGRPVSNFKASEHCQCRIHHFNLLACGCQKH